MDLHQAAGSEQCIAQQIAVASAVRGIQEARLPVVAALHDVLGDAGQIETGLSGHVRTVGFGPVAHHQLVTPRRPGIVRRSSWEVNMTLF